jgi:raffinose/stachyose/melibiose transport system substrate-binding protein
MKPHRRAKKLGITTSLFTIAASLFGISAAPGAASASTTVTTIKLAIGTPTPAQQAAWVDMDKAFESQYPNIRVQIFTEPSNSNAYRAVIGTQLRSGAGPDIVSYSPGPAFIGAFAKAGLLYYLNGAQAKYHWNFFGWTLSPFDTYNGKLDAVPVELDVIGVYYNKSIFAKYGLHPPANLSNFESEMNTLKSHGVTPIVLPDEDGWEGGHYLSITLAGTAGPQYLRALESGKTSWDSAAVINALTLMFHTFEQDGYVVPGSDGINYNDGASAFEQGQAAMFPTGEWEEFTLHQGAKFPMGFFPFPSPTGKGYWVGGVGQSLFVSSRSKNIPADLTYLNWITGATASRFLFSKYQYIPAVGFSATGLAVNPLWGQMYQDLKSVGYNPTLVGPNIDVTQYSTFNTAMWDGIQGVLNGSETPKEAAAGMQKAFLASGNS